MKKNVVIFGATGGTGLELVKQCLEKKYHVTAFVRNAEKLQLADPNLLVKIGDVLNKKDVSNALVGADAVFCSLGMPSSDRSNLRANGTRNIIEAMEATNVDRLVCQTSMGFGDSTKVLPWHMKYLIVPLILKHAFKDHYLQENIVEKSKVNWTIVRPGNMTNGKRTNSYKYGFDYNEKIKLKVSRADVADFMIMQLDSSNYYGKKVGISY